MWLLMEIKKLFCIPVDMFVSFWQNRELIWYMTKREIVSRYRGSMVGLAWSFVNPLLMLIIYTFVFSVVFKARWGIEGEESKIDFAIILFVGMVVHGLFADIVNRSPSLVVSNVNYVKKVVFPLEILSWVIMGASLFHSLISILVLIIMQFIINYTFHWTVVFFPLILLPLIFTSMGFSWFLSSLGVYLRDIGHVTGIFTTMLLFLSPVFYPVSALPREYQSFLLLNPLTFIIEESRKVLIFGKMPSWSSICIALLISFLIAVVGYWWFQKTRKGFADVL